MGFEGKIWFEDENFLLLENIGGFVLNTFHGDTRSTRTYFDNIEQLGTGDFDLRKGEVGVGLISRGTPVGLRDQLTDIAENGKPKRR